MTKATLSSLILNDRPKDPRLAKRLNSFVIFVASTFSFFMISSFGVCCVFIVSTSGGVAQQNCSYIQNPGYPSSYTGTSSVTYTIQKCTSGKMVFMINKFFYIRFDWLVLVEEALRLPALLIDDLKIFDTRAAKWNAATLLGAKQSGTEPKN